MTKSPSDQESPTTQQRDKHPGGRPRKTGVEQSISVAICKNLKIGMPITLAAEAEGVSRHAVREWMERFPEFAAAVARAHAEGARILSARAIGGGKGSAMAGWMLERRYREDYGLVTRVQLEVDEFTGRSREELEAEREKLLAKMAVRVTVEDQLQLPAGRE